MRYEEVEAQKQVRLSLLEYLINRKRAWLFIVLALLYLLFGYVYAVVIFSGLFYVAYTYAPLKISDKDENLGYILFRYLKRWERKAMKKLGKLIERFMWFSFLLALLQTQAQAQTQTQTQEKTDQEKVEKLLKEEQASSVEVEEKVIKKDFNQMTPKEVLSFMRLLNQKREILLEQTYLKVGSSYRGYLKDVNFFTYHSTLPVLFILPAKVENVVLFGERVQAKFSGKNVVYLPPASEEGRFNGFVVLFEDGRAVYFLGKRVSGLNKEETVGVVYRYEEPKPVNAIDVMKAYVDTYGACPEDKAMVSYAGGLYVFRKQPKTDQYMLNSDYVYACHVVWKVERIK